MRFPVFGTVELINENMYDISYQLGYLSKKIIVLMSYRGYILFAIKVKRIPAILSLK